MGSSVYRGFRGLGIWLGMLLCLVSCHYPTPDYSGWNMTPEERDSLQFLSEHHYTTNYNFQVICDSVRLNEEVWSTDSLFVYKGDELVVADFYVASGQGEDSVWVKVARDQATIGWLPEASLLENVVPVDPISKFIHLFSNVNTILFLIVLGLFVLHALYRLSRRKAFDFLLYREIRSVYPMLLCVLVACAATLYASIQLFAPDTWQSFYYHPTLNPLELPGVLAAFMVSVWCIVIVALAVLDDVLHQAHFSAAFFYLLGLATVCLFCYLFFTFTTLYYIGYLFLCLLLYGSYRYFRHTSSRYVCGHCGQELTQKGVCPHCGALNK